MIRRKKIAFKPVIRKSAGNGITPKSITSGTSQTISKLPDTNLSNIDISKETTPKTDALEESDSVSFHENNTVASQNQPNNSVSIENSSRTDTEELQQHVGDNLSVNRDKNKNVSSRTTIAVTTSGEPIVSSLPHAVQPASNHDLSTINISAIRSTVLDGRSQTDTSPVNSLVHKQKAASSVTIPIVPATKTREQIVKEQFGVEDKSIRQRNALRKLKNIETMHQNATAADWNNMVRDSLLVSDLIYCNPPKNAAKELGLHATLRKMQEKEKQHKDSVTSDNTQAQNQQDENEEHHPSSEVPAVIAPQIRLNEDGSIVLDEESLVISSSKPDTVVHDTPVVYENSFSYSNQANFKRFPIVKRSVWSEKQTRKFYEALKIVGADFNLMSAMFRNRTDQQLRKKFHRERKKHNWKVDEALKQQHLSKWTNDMFKPDSSSDEETVAPKRSKKQRSSNARAKKSNVTSSESLSSEAVTACNGLPVT